VVSLLKGMENLFACFGSILVKVAIGIGYKEDSCCAYIFLVDWSPA